MRHAAIHLAAWTAAALAGVPPAGAQAPAVQAPAVQVPAALGAAGPQAMQASAVPRVERQVASLQRRLRITPAQQPQWDAFTGVMRDNARHQEAAAAARAARPLTLTAPDDLRAHAAAAQAQADGMARLVPAFDALYAALSPEQRAAADQVFQQFERQALRRRAAPAG
jgi:protein CpxP